MKLVVYGSFNCPYSLLASMREDHLGELGVADVEWRAVVHDPDVPIHGEPVLGELAALFDRELEEIRSLLRGEETFLATPPAVQPNTTLAVAGFPAMTGDNADRLRTRLFDAFWVRHLDIGDALLLRAGLPQSLGLRSLTSDVVPGLAFLAGGVVAIAA